MRPQKNTVIGFQGLGWMLGLLSSLSDVLSFLDPPSIHGLHPMWSVWPCLGNSVSLLCDLSSPRSWWCSVSLSYVPFPPLAQSWYGVLSRPDHQGGLLFLSSPAFPSLSPMNGQEMLGPAHTLLGPREVQEKLYTDHSSGYCVEVVNYFWCHRFLSPLTFHQGGPVMIYNKIYSSGLCFFSFLIYLPKMLPYIWPKSGERGLGPPDTALPPSPETAKGRLDLSLLW